MSLLGYEALFAKKSHHTGRQEGVALFFKQDKFDLEESKKLFIDEIATDILAEAEPKTFGEVLILAALRHKNSNTMVLTGTNLAKATRRLLGSGILIYLKRKTHYTIISLQMHAKYQNLGKRGILYTHNRPKFWHIPKFFGPPCYDLNQ